MKIHLNKLLVVLFLNLAVSLGSFAQLTIQNYTACPNQTVMVSTTWNNASSNSYSVYGPPLGLGGPPFVILVAPQTTFAVSNPGAGPPSTDITYTVVGSAVVGGVLTTNTVNFVLKVIPPAPMAITGNTVLCHNGTLTLSAPLGANSYTIQSPSCNAINSLPNPSSSNIFQAFPITNACSGLVTVTGDFGGCIRTGTTLINVAPLSGLVVSNPTSVCQGQCVTFTANLVGAPAYEWEFKNAPIGSSFDLSLGGNCALGGPGVTVNDGGVYTVKAEQPFAGILCPYTATTQLTVVQTNPVIPSASPNGTICQGHNLNLSATAGQATGWSWSGPSLNSQIANPVISPALPTNSGCYTVTATFQGAFIACTTSAAICVSVVPVSIPVISMPSSVCQDATFTVTGSATNNPNLTWSGPLFSGNTPTMGAAITITNVPTSASGTQFLTALYSLGTVQCLSTSSVQLNVVPVNTISMVTPPPVCIPDNVFLQSLATGANQYSWQGPNGYSNFGPNVWVMYPDLKANGIYTVTAYFGSGSSLVCSNMNTVEVVVNPVLSFALEPRQQVCYNASVTILGPPGATSYTWTSSTGFTSFSKDISFSSIQPKNTGTYTLTASLGPCASSAESEIVVLTPISFTLTPFDRTVCAGDTVFLEGGATGGSDNYAYEWNPAVYLESSNGPKQMSIPFGSVGYNLVVHDIACPSYSIAHSFNVKVNQPPVPKLELASNSGCAPFKMRLDPKTHNEAFVTNYDFYGIPDSIRQDVDTLPYFDYTLRNPGTYYLKIYSVGKQAIGGCKGTYEYPSPIVVFPKPGTEVHWEPETPITDDVVTFFPTHSNDALITHYTWNFMGGITPGDTLMNNAPGKSDTTNIKTPVRVYSQYGNYPVVLISQNEHGCIDTIAKDVKVIDEMQIFVPNTFTPNDDGINDIFMAKGTGVRPEGFTMDIFNRAGVNIFTTKDINQGWDGKVGGQFTRDATYIYKIKAVGMNGEGRREFTGHVSILK